MISYFNKVFIISLEFPKVGKNDKNNMSFQIKARLVNIAGIIEQNQQINAIGIEI